MSRGSFRVHDAGRGWAPLTPYTPNAELVTAASIVVRTAFLRDPAYALSTMYVEFENVAGPGVPATIPAIDPEDLNYYPALASSLTRDYLRVPLLFPPEVSVASGFEGVLTAALGNQVIARAIAAGTQGVHGRAFSAAARSVICGCAIVATPVPGDPAQDIPFARAYYAQAAQVAISAGLEVGVSYRWYPEV